MTADIRTAAQREARQLREVSGGFEYGMNRSFKLGFIEGAVWAQARVTPTREQIERALIGRDFIAGTNAVLALMAGLAEGESSGKQAT